MRFKFKDLLDILSEFKYEILWDDISSMNAIHPDELLTLWGSEGSPPFAAFIYKPNFELKEEILIAIIDKRLYSKVSILRDRVSIGILVPNARKVLLNLLRRLHKPWWAELRGVHPLSLIENDVSLGENVWIGPYVTIMRGTQIGSNVKIFPYVYIGREVMIGENTVIFPGAVIMDRVRIGCNTIIQPGAIIGGDGFGFEREGSKWEKIPHIGYVEIGDNVEIGCNTTVDRATIGKTLIANGTKIDNLVQVGHNVQVGENSLLISQVGIGGSTVIGSNVILAGQVGVKDNLTIGDSAQIGGGSIVVKPVPAGAKYWGFPAMEMRKWVKLTRS